MTITTLNLKDKERNIQRYHGPGAKPHYDGYWVKINDWSQCTLKCGGGLSYQQWVCIPPRRNGRPCVGAAIRTKPCNEMPCPLSNEYGTSFQANENNTVLPPIYKMIPFSNRPQRYIKCQIKESDVLFKDWSNPHLKEAVKSPARLVMNNATISLYQDEAYTSSLFTFRLQLTTISKDQNDECCFVLKSNNQRFELCSFEKDCGTRKKPKFYNEWSKDFSIFSSSCYDPPNAEECKKKLSNSKNKTTVQGSQGNEGGFPGGGSISISTSEANQIKQSLKSPEIINQEIKLLSKSEMKLLQERENSLEKKMEKEVKKELNSKIEKTEQTVMKALRKEDDIEELIKNEEISKIKTERKKLMKRFKHEAKKKELLKKDLKPKRRRR